MNSEATSYKKWNIFIISAFIIGIILIAGMVFFIDPYWHFHGSTDGVAYRLGNGRYMNDGILRNYEYDTVIIGTSMSENFKPSIWEGMTGETTVKVPFFGASYKEIHDNLERAFSYNDDIRTVIWGLDYNQITAPWDRQKYESYPEYLYDDTYLNDGNYLWNKTVLIRGLLPSVAYTILGKESTGFDEYNSWEEPSGREAVMADFTPGNVREEQAAFTEDVKVQIEKNVYENIESVVKEHPDTQFYLFFTPYSIAYWDTLYYSSQYNVQMEATKIFAERLLQYDNVKLFSFFDNTEMICDLNNYVDSGHYVGEINDLMLDWMYNEEYMWTPDNYEEKVEEINDFYSNFNYQEFWTE